MFSLYWAGGWTPLHLVVHRGQHTEPIHTYRYKTFCFVGDEDLVKLLLAKGARIDAKTRNGNTPVRKERYREKKYKKKEA
jgi:ankyrin repeat protein